MRTQVIWFYVCLLFSGFAPVQTAEACRCPLRELASYYAQSDWVWLSVLKSATPADNQRVELKFQHPARYYKSNHPKPERILTGATTAQCGLPVEPGATYLLFSEQNPSRPGTAIVHTCNGSRRLESGTAAPAEIFPGTPVRLLEQQLESLAGIDLLRQISAATAGIGEIQSENLIGLQAFSLDTITVFQAPNLSETAVDVPMDHIEQREIAEQRSGLVVYSRQGDWLKVRVENRGFGWISQGPAKFHSYEQLPLRRLSYLNEHWSGYLWPEIGAGLPFFIEASTRHSEIPVEVTESQWIGGSLWFHVRLYKEGPCESPGSGFVASGWVPGYGRHGNAVLWYHARGC